MFDADLVNSLKMDSGRDGSDEDSSDTGDLASLFTGQFELHAEMVITTTPTYILHMCGRVPSSSRIAVGLSDRSFAVYDTNTLTKIATAVAHQKTLSGLRFSIKSDDLLYTCSMDGTIKLWDLRTDLKSCKKEFNDDTSDSSVFKPLTTFDISPNNRFLCAGTEHVDGDTYLLFWDTRSSKLLGGYWESHTDDITQVCFDPSKQNTMATGSTDGLINIFDISKPSEDDALEYCLNTESSVAKLTWLGGDSLSCITHTEDLQLWKVDGAAPEMQFSRESIAQSLQKKSAVNSYLVDVHRKKAPGEALLLAGSNARNGQCLRSFQVTSQGIKPMSQFLNNRQIVRASWYLENDQDERLITGGENGYLNVWKPRHAASGHEELSLPHMASSLKMPSKLKKYKDFAKPYKV